MGQVPVRPPWTAANDLLSQVLTRLVYKPPTVEEATADARTFLDEDLRQRIIPAVSCEPIHIARGIAGGWRP